MSTSVRRVSYYYATAEDRPGSAYQVLNEMARHEVNLLAFSIVPMGPTSVQVTLFPEDPERLERAAASLGLNLTQPQQAFLMQGDDELGALSEAHRRLFDARINVYASNGVSDNRGGFGYLIYVRPDDYERAAEVLGV
jgi:hypothetical protein